MSSSRRSLGGIGDSCGKGGVWFSAYAGVVMDNDDDGGDGRRLLGGRRDCDFGLVIWVCVGCVVKFCAGTGVGGAGLGGWGGDGLVRYGT